jgi:hypothetical protein
VGDGKDIFYRYISLAAFNGAYVRSVEFGAVGKFFLRKANLVTNAPYVVANDLLWIRWASKRGFIHVSATLKNM